MKNSINVSELDWGNPNAMLSWFLIASYAYYVIGDRIMEDSQFDRIAKILKDNWDSVDHPHKHLVTQSHLDAGTGYDITFPTIVKHNAHLILKEIRK